MASDKMLGSFDQKSAPEDNDLLVEYDAAASKVKNVKFGGVWNWIVKKLTSAVINELQTSSKNVVGAINELNSKTMHSKIVKAKNVSIPTIGYTETMINKPQNTVFVGINNFGKINPASPINIALSDYDGTVYIFGLPGTNIDWIEIICLFCN